KRAGVGEARFQHLGEAQRGDRLELLGTHAIEEAVHELAPAPEAVRARRAPFRQSRETPLKRMAVEVRQSRQRDRVALIAQLRLRSGAELRDAPGARGAAHAPRPTRRQQGRLKPEAGHGVHYSLSAAATSALERDRE